MSVQLLYWLNAEKGEQSIMRKKARKRIEIRLYDEEMELLNEKVRERGMDRTTYIKERILQDNVTILYNKEIKQCLEDMLKLFDLIEEICPEEYQYLIKLYQEEVKKFWQYLR